MKHLKFTICSLALLFFFSINAKAWNAPGLSSPSNGSSNYTTVTLDWYAVSGSQKYQLQVDTVSSFDSPYLTDIHKDYISSSNSGSDTQHSLSNLFFGKTYYWRVRAYIEGDTSAWSTRNFTTSDFVTLSSPSNNGTGEYTSTTVDWYAHYGVAFYDVQIDTSANFNSPLFQSDSKAYISTSSSNPDTQHSVTNLRFGTKYYWRVRARNTVDTSDWSMRNFTTSDFVALSSPSNNGTGEYTSTTVDWYAHYGVAFYDVQIDTSANFNSPLFQSDSKAYISTSSSNPDTQHSVTNLRFGTKYYWRVRARNTVDTSDWSMRNFTTSDFVTLSSPSNNGTGEYTSTTVDWYAHYGVAFYDVQIDTSANFNSPLFQSDSKAYISTSSSNPDTQHSVANLRFGTKYYWRVRARNTVDTSDWSMRNFTTSDFVALSSPSNNGTGEYTSTTVDWYAHHGVAFYDVQIDTSANFNSPLFQSDSKAYISTSSSNPDTQHSVANLRFGTKYYWRVRARNTVDTSAWSMRSFTTSDFVALSSPSNNGTGEYTSTTVDWYAHNGVAFYDVQIDTSANFNSPLFQSDSKAYISTSSSNTDTQHSVANLRFGTKYYWRVRARNTVDTSDWSMRNFTTSDFVALSSPSNNGTGEYTSTTVDWYAHNGVAFYDVQIDTSANFNSPLFQSDSKAYISTSSSNPDTQHSVANLRFGTKYYWRVRARNTVDTSDWSMRNFTTSDFVTLSSPSNGALNINTAGTTLNWDAHYGISYYQVQIDTTNLFNSPYLSSFNKAYINSSSSNADTEHATGSLLANKIYFWRVRAINGAVNTSLWNVRSFSTGSSAIQIPAAPALISPIHGVQNHPVNTELVWQASTYATSYQVLYDTDPQFSSALPISTTNISRPLTGLSYNTVYYWKVRAVKGNSIYSDWSAARSFTTGAEPVVIPGVPVPVSPVNGATGQPIDIELTWQSATNAVSYRLLFDTDPSFTSTTAVIVNSTSKSIPGLLYNTTYYWKVQAVSGSSDYSDWSSVWSFTTVCPAIAAPVVAGGGNFCDSVHVTLTATGGSQFNWYSDNAGTQLITTGAAYSLTLYTGNWSYWVSSVNGDCESGLTEVMVMVYEGPAKPVIIQNNATLTSSVTGAQYQWFYENTPIENSDHISYQADETGNYTVTVTNEHHCSSTSDEHYFMHDTGVEDYTALKIKVYPNPTKEKIYIENIPVHSLLQIFDAKGIAVYSESAGEQTKEIDISNLASGMYVISIKTQAGEIGMRKFLKE